MKNIYKPTEAVVESIIVETPAIKTFVLRPKENFSFRTGQFIELTLPGIGEAVLRRPPTQRQRKDRDDDNERRKGHGPFA